MKRITSFLLAILMLVTLVPVDSAYAMGGEKLDVVPLSDGQYMIKLPGVDYTRVRQVPEKPNINPTDNPDDFEDRLITVDISEIVIDALEADGTKIDSVTITVTCGDANYSKEYVLTKDKFGEDGGLEAPVPVADYFPQIYVKFSDGRDSRYLVEAKNIPHNVVNITLDLLGHTGVATRWHGNSERPSVKANYIGLNKSAHKFDLPKVDQNTVLRSPSNTFQWRGHDNLVLLPTVPEEDIKANDTDTAKVLHLEIQDALQGKLADSKYYFQITGESYTASGFTATMREKYTVDFDAGDGKWKTAKPAQQFSAHGLKLNETFMKAPDTIGPVTVPNGATELTPPAEAGKPENVFKGWATTADGPVVNMATYVVEGDTTFYAIYGPKDQGKVTIQYVDKSGTAIDDKYKVQGVDYPKFAEGNKGEDVDAKSIPQPAFIGYERNGDIVVTGKKYDENGKYTVEVPYKKLDSIIPEKKNGNDNPDATTDVKKHYAKVTYQVDTKDAEKAKLQLDGADAKSPLVYYVNPVEGIAIKDVAKVNAVSKDANLYNVDANDMWTYDPNTITNTNQVISQATDSDGNVVKTEITLTAKVADKTAVKFKDKLKPVDIKVWEDKTDTDGSKIDWKKGVALKDDNADLKKILDKTETKVTDKNNRNSSNANLPNGQKGDLLVTFEDGSTIEVKDQTLYVAPHKNDDNTNLPKDAVKVDFKIGEGVTGTAKTEYVKPGTDVKADAPAVIAKEGFKDAKWYKDEATTEATDADYKVTANAEFIAKATGKDKVVKLDDPENPTNFPKDPTDNSKKDADYVTVKFVADANGKIKEGNAEKAKGIAYAVLKNTEWADAVAAGVVVPTVDAEGNAPKLVGKDKFHSFNEWQKDGTKVTDFAKVTADVTYTAVFGKADEFSVTYNLNAPEGLTVGGIAPTDNTKYLKDEEVTVKALAADNKIAGYQFTGWNTQTDGKGTAYAADTKFAIKANTNLFAQWEKTAKDIIPVDNENDKKGKNGEEIPDNYVFVEFKVKDTDADKAEIKANQQDKFKVDPKVKVTLTAPELELKDAYKDSHIAKFNEADYTKKVFAQKTTIWASVTEKDKVTVKYVFNTNPVDKTLPKDLADLKPADGTEKIYETDVVAPNALDLSSEAVKKALVEKDKDGKEIGTWTAGNWSNPVKDDVNKTLTYTLTWTFTEAGKPQPTPQPMPTPEYNPWWPIYFGSTKTEAKKEEPKPLQRHEAYISGYPDGTVRPDGKITRAEVSAIFARLTENSSLADFVARYSDVKSTDWFADSIMKLSAKDIITGYPDGTFKPNKSITRAEFAVIASKYIKNPKAADETFSDVPMNHWAKDAIAKVKAEGWISGYTDGTFKPDAPITRAEAVSIVNRMFDRAADGEFVREHGFEIKHFNDLTDKHWAYYEIMEAVHTHDYVRIDKRTERWDKIVK